MPTKRLRLSEPDRPRFVRGDEWFDVVSEETIADIEEALIEELEEVAGVGIVGWLRKLEDASLESLRQMLWFCRRVGGVDEPYEQFRALKPRVLAIEFEDLPGTESPGNPAAAPANRAERRASTRSKSGASKTSARSTGSTSGRRSTASRGTSAG